MAQLWKDNSLELVLGMVNASFDHYCNVLWLTDDRAKPAYTNSQVAEFKKELQKYIKRETTTK